MITASVRLFVASMSLAIVAACGGAPGAASKEAAASAPATFAEQVAAGQVLYGEHCASCHGAAGQGDGAPALVGLAKGALPLDPPPAAKARKVQFKTVADIGAFVIENMPPNKGGSLTQEQYLDVLAFDLKANGIELPTRLELADASHIVVPR